MSETKWRKGLQGLLECYNVETGEVVYVEKKKTLPSGERPKRRTWATDDDHHWVVDSNGRKHWVLKGTNPDSLGRFIYPFCQTTVDAICMLVTEGHTITEIGAMEGFPPRAVLYRWTRDYPEFKAALKLAKEARAEFFADQAIVTAEDAQESNVQSARLQVDTYKWAAEVGNRNEYGKQTKVTGDPDAPIGFIIDTGIRRTEPTSVPSGPASNPALVEAPASRPTETQGQDPNPMRNDNE